MVELRVSHEWLDDKGADDRHVDQESAHKTHVQDADQRVRGMNGMRDDIILKLEILLHDFLNSADNLLNGSAHKDSVTWH